MTNNIDFGVFQLCIDIDKTREYYEKMPVIPNDCVFCENYIAAIHQSSNKTIKTIQSLGIDSLRIANVSFMYCPDAKTAFYDCIAFVCGSATYRGEGTTAAVVYQDVAFCIQTGEQGFYPNRQSLPEFAVELSYQVLLPWVVNKKPEKWALADSE